MLISKSASGLFLAQRAIKRGKLIIYYTCEKQRGLFLVGSDPPSYELRRVMNPDLLRKAVHNRKPMPDFPPQKSLRSGRIRHPVLLRGESLRSFPLSSRGN